ncbi:glycosyltransferase family 2 protein [Sphingomonas aracearum]|uniref:Glycosyltransferase family 2 protein n=1 Tax=Sphingomonas aracearum TaxID=2283317 RepID=A0A369VTY5_9SPHN|nr:glycosyltransferase family 2 protein [Sphingomonas aracearum]RDE05319.1 glycosyltransferase family 2 protein [Sphingomonas aracearum]
MPRLYVIIATVGRADLTRRTVALLHDQTRPPDGVVVVGAAPADIEGVADAAGRVEAIIGDRGLPRQRNRGLDAVNGRADLVVFFDDDFVPAPDYLEQVEALFTEFPDVSGITGNLIADGINAGGFSLEQARELVANGAAAMDAAVKPRSALYGCNMAIRLSAAQGLRFDEKLPLYGWLEDIDFTVLLGRRGRLISSGRVTGVHMGVKGGRTSGRKLGYSQVANVVYLYRKGSMQPGLGRKLLLNNVVSNLVKSLRPEPDIDRRGRLYGNALAIADVLRGRVDPRRIERL